MNKKHLMYLVVVFVVVCFVMTGMSVFAQRKGVVIADLNWSSAIAVENLMIEVLENRLNIPVTKKTVSVAMAWAGMDQGSIDIAPEIWWPNQEEAIQQYVRDKKSIEMQLIYDNARQGFWIPTWVSEKYGIRSIHDLNKHGELFDFTGDKVGDIWLGGYGWFSNDIHRAKLANYGLKYDPYIVVVWVFMTQLKEAMRTKRPIIFYFWEPDWIFALYDLTLIEEPPYDPNKWQYDDKNPSKSKIACEWQPARVYAAYNKELGRKNPKAYRFVKNFYIPLDELYQIIADIEDVPDNPKQDPRAVAKKWIQNHPAIVNDWLK